jgi:hypothetical protein
MPNSIVLYSKTPNIQLNAVFFFVSSSYAQIVKHVC